MVCVAFCALCLAVLPCGCAQQAEPVASPACQSISAWPRNAYTNGLPQPQAGQPDYTITAGLSDSSAGYYAVFYKGVSREEGEQYIAQLKEAGFSTIAQADEPAAGGIVLVNGEKQLSVSVSDGALGVYIAQSPAD